MPGGGYPAERLNVPPMKRYFDSFAAAIIMEADALRSPPDVIGDAEYSACGGLLQAVL
jgi:hypothetical protein